MTASKTDTVPVVNMARRHPGHGRRGVAWHLFTDVNSRHPSVSPDHDCPSLAVEDARPARSMCRQHLLWGRKSCGSAVQRGCPAAEHDLSPSAGHPPVPAATHPYHLIISLILCLRENIPPPDCPPWTVKQSLFGSPSAPMRQIGFLTASPAKLRRGMPGHAACRMRERGHA